MTDPIQTLREALTMLPEMRFVERNPDALAALDAVAELATAARAVEAAFAADPHDQNELWNASGPLRAALVPFDPNNTT